MAKFNKSKLLTPQQFVDEADKVNTQVYPLDLRSLSLEQLAKQFSDVQKQSYVLLGKILLEARQRFVSDIEFGSWRSNNLLGVNMAQASRLMNLARFFDDENRPLSNIPVSVGYLISAPINEPIAEVVYAKLLELEKPNLKDAKKLIERLTPTHGTNRKKEQKTSTIAIDNIMLMINKLTTVELNELFGKLKEHYPEIRGCK